MSSDEDLPHLRKVTDIITEFNIGKTTFLTNAYRLDIHLAIEIPKDDIATFIIGLNTRDLIAQQNKPRFSNRTCTLGNPIRLPQAIEYFEVPPSTYQELKQKNNIARLRFEKVIDFDSRSEIISLDLTQCINKYSEPEGKTTYLNGDFCTFEKIPKERSESSSEFLGNEKHVRISVENLLIKSADAKILAEYLKPQENREAWLSDKLRYLNKLHMEYFGITSDIDTRATGDIKDRIKLKLMHKWNITNSDNALIREAIYSILPDEITKLAAKITIPSDSAIPACAAHFRSTALKAINVAAAELWKEKLEDSRSAYPSRGRVSAILNGMGLTSNIVINIPTVIRPEFELRANARDRILK